MTLFQAFTLGILIGGNIVFWSYGDIIKILYKKLK